MCDNDENFEDALTGLENPETAAELKNTILLEHDGEILLHNGSPSRIPAGVSVTNSLSSSTTTDKDKPKQKKSAPKDPDHETETQRSTLATHRSKTLTIGKVIDVDDSHGENDIALLKAMKLSNLKHENLTKTLKVVDDFGSTPSIPINNDMDHTLVPFSKKRSVSLTPAIKKETFNESIRLSPALNANHHTPGSFRGRRSKQRPNSTRAKPSTPCSKAKAKMKVIDETLTEKERIAMLFRDPTTTRGRKPKEDLELLSDVRPFGSPKYPGRPRRPPSPSFRRLDAKVVEVQEGDGIFLSKEENVAKHGIRRTKRRIHRRVRLGEEASGDEGYNSENAAHVDDDSDDNFKPTYTPKIVDGIRRGRGRPRKIRADLEDYSRSARGSAGDKDEIKVLDNYELPAKRTFKSTEKKQAGMITEIPDEDPEELGTNFLFLNNHESKGRKRGKKSTIEVANKERLLRAEAFSSPKKQRIGLLDLPSTTSPSKRGIFSTLSYSPNKTPTGRGGSPRKINKREDQDRSARKRANRTLYSKLLEDGVEDSDDEDYNENVRVAEKIIIQSKSAAASNETTPYGTPRKSKPFDLPLHNPHFVASPLPTIEDEEEFMEGRHDDKALFLDGPDGFFDQHSHKVKPSNNSMVQAPAIDYDEFNSLMMFSGFLHHTRRAALNEKYEELYTQWRFELEENFSLLFFGIGSKRKFLLSFVEDYLLDFFDVPVVVVNGYNPALKLNEILQHVLSSLKLQKKVPKRQGEAVDFIVDHLKKKSDGPKLILLIHNLDGESLRDEKVQSYIAKLSSSQQVKVIASVDHINAPLLWDSDMLSKFNFLWHNITNYSDYITETSFRDPLALGRTQKSSGAKGAKFVLASLTSSSRDLYRVLAESQLSHMEEDLETKKDAQSHSLKGSAKHALEFTKFFLLCVEEFISSNEINFRTMLMEFVEHKMAILTKDQAGTELVFIPFTMDEIQTLLKEVLMTDDK